MRPYFYTQTHIAEHPDTTLCDEARNIQAHPYEHMSLEWAKIVVQYNETCPTCKSIIDARWNAEHARAFQGHSDTPY